MEEIKATVPPEITLEVNRLSVHFGATQVLKDLSFRVAKGSALAIVGPNGAGKTVLLKTLIGSLPLTGSVQWEAGVRIGYVPQKLDLERDIPIAGVDFLKARASGGYRQTAGARSEEHALGFGSALGDLNDTRQRDRRLPAS